MDRLKIVLLATGVAAAVAATCGAVNGPAEWPIARAPAALRPAISRADLVIADVHGAFLRELRAKMAKGGPLVALRVCHMTPQLLARQIQGRNGVAAGFTSDRLRNPANAPPPWAGGLIARHAGQQADTIDGFAVDLGSRVGVLRPIAEQPVCATCHGPAERLDPQIRRELARRYHTDRATGFNPGEIRGWYWVEIAKEDPTWDVPVSIQRETAGRGAPVLTTCTPAPDNPLGGQWDGLMSAGIRLHGTMVPSSVYRFATHGCIRLQRDGARTLFEPVSGT